MTDELKRDIPNEDTYEIEHGLETHEIERGADASPEAGKSGDEAEETNPWLKEGADAPDAADIEDPSEQR
jgi:hypothetical protein